MIKNNAITFAVLACLASAPAVLAPEKATTQEPVKAEAPGTAQQDQNLKEYITLLRKDVRSQKAAVMNAVMQLDTDQSAKFWPIYRDYDTELTKLNDLRVANIEEYSRTYNHLTDEKGERIDSQCIRVPEASCGSPGQVLRPRKAIAGCR